MAGKAMSVERLHFTSGAMEYHAVHAAEHISRYAFAAPLCAGKRVLDVACGEGYGTFILAGEGAAEVVGVDIAEDAIAVARQRFARDRVEFLAGDALHLPAVLGQRAPFDVIVSFETIEHLSDPDRFLNGIRRMLVPGGVIILSCPNDALERANGNTNPFHLRAYTFDEFRGLTSGALGSATRWYLGTPLQGMVLAEASFSALRNDSSDPSLLLDIQEAPRGHLLPTQSNLRVTPENCTFYLGIWGAPGNAVQVAAAMSGQGYLEPWWALEHFKQREERLKEQVAFLEDQIDELRRASRLEKTRRIPQQVHEAAVRLREIESSRGYRLLQRYYALAYAPVTGPVIQSLRRFARRVLRLARRLHG
jgi:ubiquinone/menaquinone biosynthesis C-methylase UbiE